MKDYKLICFDVDGVIFSSEKILVPAYEKIILEYNKKENANVKVPTLEEILAEVGKPSIKIMKNLFPKLSKAGQDFISSGILEGLVYFIEKGDGYIFPEIEKVLAHFSKLYRLAVSSNGRQAYIEAILKKYNLRQYFEEPLFISTERNTKGKILAGYINRYEISGNELLMIGDRQADRDAAKQNSCDFVGCLYGHGSKEELEGAIYFAESSGDLLGI